MDIGDRVVYYTHEASDSTHTINDFLAFAVGKVDDKTVDVVIFPPGGPLRWERVSLFDPDSPYLTTGGSYWREVGSKAPDFDKPFAFANHPEWVALQRRQQEEMKRLPSPDQTKLLERHKAEVGELYKKLSSEQKPVAKPAERPLALNRSVEEIRTQAEIERRRREGVQS